MVVIGGPPGWGYTMPVPIPLSHNGVYYPTFLAMLGEHLAPRSYFEIGTDTGVSLAAFSCDAVCIDPEFQLGEKPTGRRARTLLYQMTSDEFFSTYDLRRDFPAGPDICFLDGMHLSECLLRDFINAERSCHAGSLILMHDCLPTNLRMAQRKREVDEAEPEETRYHWTGDVWRVIRALCRHRPDLQVRLLDCPPTGLVACTGLDPASEALAQNYPAIVGEMLAESLSEIGLETVWETYPMIDTNALAQRLDDLIALFRGVRR
jgi:hypothetical protein